MERSTSIVSNSHGQGPKDSLVPAPQMLPDNFSSGTVIKSFDDKHKRVITCA